MRKSVLAGLAGLGLAVGGPASAATMIVLVDGVVTEQYATLDTLPGATSPIQVGDTITARFSYTTGDSIGEMLARSFSMIGANLGTFTLDGYKWSSMGDFLGDIAPPQLAAGEDPLAHYYSTMDDAPGAGDLRIRGYGFDIGEFGYGLYQGPGFRGTFDKDSVRIYRDGEMIQAPVPELTTWAQIIAGFVLVGTAFRRRRAARQDWRKLVSRLSGRIREA